jgi:phytanoyl-CoA hydroxylase
MNALYGEQDAELKAQFDEHGYVSLPGFLSPEEVADLNRHIDTFIADVAPTMPRERVFYEDVNDPSTLKQLLRLYEFDQTFHKMAFNSRFERLAELLLGEAVTVENMQYFNKPPKAGKASPAHQDGYYFMLKPNHALSFWIALEDVDEETGCVRYVDRSHKWGMRAHGSTGTLGFSQGILDYGIDNDLQNEIAFPCRAGHLLAHHSLTIHRSDGNRSDTRTRRALGFMYSATSAVRVDEDAYAAYQKQLAEDMAAQGKL